MIFSQFLDAPEFRNAKFLTIFRRQLDELSLAKVIHPYAVLDELRALEQPERFQTKTKKASAFVGGPLDGLMHKHFFMARHLPKNIQNVWLQPGRMDRVLRTVVAGARTNDIGVLSRLMAERVVHQAMRDKNRARSLTGDWIIYKSHGGKNHYLSLAGHNEDRLQIFLRLASATAEEFPELAVRDAA